MLGAISALKINPRVERADSSICCPLEPEEYDYNRIPADIKLAKIHGKAKRVYADENKESQTCQCCGLPITGKQIPLAASLEKLAHLGSGYPLYFNFTKYAIGMLLMMFFVGGIYNLVTNIETGDCSDSTANAQKAYCIQGFIHSFIISNKREESESLRIQAVLNLITVFMVMFFFHYLRYKIRKMNVEADEKTVTPSDYAIEIQDLPEDISDEELKTWIYQIAGHQDIEILRITKVYAISKYVKLINKKSNFEMKKAKLEIQPEYMRFITRKMTLGKKKIKQVSGNDDVKKVQINTKLNSISQKIQGFEGMDRLKRCPVVYVTFKTAQQAEEIRNLKKADTSRFYHIFFSEDEFTRHDFGEKKVKIRRAPEPSDILWENIEYIGQEKLKIRLLTYIGTFMATCFGIILVVNYSQGMAQSHYGKSSGVAQGLSIVVSLVIFLTNSILAQIIKYLTSFEKHITYTHYLRGVAQKLSIAQFMNTALTNLFAQLILASSGSVSSGLENLNIYGKGGLLENMYYIFITNAFLPPILTILDPSYFLKLFQRRRLEKKGSHNKLTQMKANLLYEGPILDLPFKYAGMIKTVLLATFYTPAMPFALIFTTVGLALWFWADKWVLIRRLVLPKSINNDLTDSMVEYLEWAVFTFAAGNVVYVYTLKNSLGEFAFDDTSRALVWVTLGISLFHIYFPMEALNKKLLPIHQKACETKTFSEARLNFTTDYDIENPLTHKSALKKHIQRLGRSAEPEMKEKAMVLHGLKAGYVLGLTQLLNPKTTDRTNIHEMEDPNENEEHEIDWNFLHIYMRKIQENQQDALIKQSVKHTPILGALVRGLYNPNPKPKKITICDRAEKLCTEEENILTPSTPNNKIYPILN